MLKMVTMITTINRLRMKKAERSQSKRLIPRQRLVHSICRQAPIPRIASGVESLLT